MNVFEILAIIGALSWLYPFVKWTKEMLTKTEVDIIVHKDIEVGYTFYGPIINLNVAFAAKNKDAFIKDIHLTLVHQNNDTNVFKWEWFEEVLLEMVIPESGSVPYKKSQKAIAIKVPADFLIEKKVSFQNHKFQKEYSQQYSVLNETYINFKNSNKELSDLKSTNEYNSLSETFKKYFPWQMGKYEGTIEVFISESDETFKKSFSFEITGLDLKNLEYNLKICRESLENHFIKQENTYTPKWQWAFLRDIQK